MMMKELIIMIKGRPSTTCIRFFANFSGQVKGCTIVQVILQYLQVFIKIYLLNVNHFMHGLGFFCGYFSSSMFAKTQFGYVERHKKYISCYEYL